MPSLRTSNPGIFLMTSAMERSCRCLKPATENTSVSLSCLMRCEVTFTSLSPTPSSVILTVCPLANSPTGILTSANPILRKEICSTLLSPGSLMEKVPSSAVREKAATLPPLPCSVTDTDPTGLSEASVTFPVSGCAIIPRGESASKSSSSNPLFILTGAWKLWMSEMQV